MKPESPINYLELIPIRILEHKMEENGLVTLCYPRFTNKFWRKLISKRAKESFIYLHLDELGSKTWLLMDGKTTVEEICNQLTIEFGDKIQPVEERTTQFLTQLFKNKYISLLQPTPSVSTTNNAG